MLQTSCVCGTYVLINCELFFYSLKITQYNPLFCVCLIPALELFYFFFCDVIANTRATVGHLLGRWLGGF